MRRRLARWARRTIMGGAYVAPEHVTVTAHTRRQRKIARPQVTAAIRRAERLERRAARKPMGSNGRRKDLAEARRVRDMAANGLHGRRPHAR